MAVLRALSAGAFKATRSVVASETGRPTVITVPVNTTFDPLGLGLPQKFYTDFGPGYLPDVFEPLGFGKPVGAGGNAYLQADGSCNPYNKELQFNRPDNVRIAPSMYDAAEGNVMALTTRAESYTTTLAANRTDPNFDYLTQTQNPRAGRDALGNPRFAYTAGHVGTQSQRLTGGRGLSVQGNGTWVVSARMRWPNHSGYWPAFWSLADDSNFTYVTEYDYMEDFGTRVFGPNVVVANMWKGFTQLPYNQRKVKSLDLSLFHTWIVHCTPTRLRVYVDSVLFFDSELYRAEVPDINTYFYAGKIYFIFQGAQIGGTGSNGTLATTDPFYRDLGAQAQAALPLRMEVSHFGVWENSPVVANTAVVGFPTTPALAS